MPSQSSDVKLEIGHVLFIDIVGYSKLLINEQSEQIQKLKEIVRGTEQVRLAEAEGKLLRLPTGDGGALVFRTSPEAPVLCALEIAKALKDHPELRIRMGIHSGPVNEISDLNEQANIAGAGINIAQRVMDCGDAGHILLSKRVADDLEQYPQWRSQLHDLGECEVKHGARVSIVNLYTDDVGNAAMPARFTDAKKMSGPSGKRLTTFQIVLALSILLILFGIPALIFTPAILKSYRGAPKRETVPPAVAAPAVAEKSIAVLPFENRSEDKANAYFADGIQDEILTRLSKIADLKVISRTSTQHYKSAPENLPEIAKQLGVAHIVEGSVQKSGDSVRVNVQLIKAANDSHLWADTFDRKLTDIFSVESEVARAIADQLQAKLTGQEEQVIAAKPTDNLEAYDAYLRGLAYTLKTSALSAANSLAAQKYFKEAVRLDPKFAQSWALLSIVDSRGYISANLQPTVALREEARQSAETAFTLDPNLGEALLAKGNYHYACLKDYDTAVRYFEQARQLLPNSSRIPESLAYVARRRGQWDRSESYFADAERLDPRNVSLLTQSAINYSARRRFPEARWKLDQVLDIVPDDIDTLANKASIAQAEGDLPRASALLAPLRPTANDRLALRIKTYQAILERRPAQIIPLLKEVWAKPDPAIGYINPEQHFWLGWAQEVAGDHSAAQETWRQVRSEEESFLKEQPDNYRLMSDLALTDMALGDKAAALTLAERAVVANPIEKDNQLGLFLLEILARVAAGMGEPDRAIAALQQLLSRPFFSALAGPSTLTPALLRLDPMFDPLRNDPRFQKLAAAPAPKDSKP
jgi:TolB-like protein/class 3 adenylate cyclase/Tfp pilus assembly protein PilF